MASVGAVEFAALNVLNSEMLRLSGSGTSISFGWEASRALLLDPCFAINAEGNEGRVPFDASSALQYHLKLDDEYPPELRRLFGRAQNYQQSSQLVAGLVVLLSVCGWSLGGNEAARALVVGATPADSPQALSPDAKFRDQGARLLDPYAVPGLYEATDKIARRAGMAHTPKLYHIADENMNAYAFGSPKAAAITLTDGLLRRLSPTEITGILAHEIAHICSNDTWTMAFADSLHKRIVAIAPVALALIRTGKSGAPLRPFEALLYYAPILAQLLYFGLSRTREHDADAMALQLTDNPHALVRALAELEHHHNGPFTMSAMAPREDVSHYFNSHPKTSERVGKLMNFAG